MYREYHKLLFEEELDDVRAALGLSPAKHDTTSFEVREEEMYLRAALASDGSASAEVIFNATRKVATPISAKRSDANGTDVEALDEEEERERAAAAPHFWEVWYMLMLRHSLEMTNPFRSYEVRFQAGETPPAGLVPQ